MSDEFIKALEGLTDRVIAVRVLYERGLIVMPLEIKGLKTNMLKVAQRIERLNAKAVAFDEIGAGVEQGLDDITAQVKGHGEDMTFAATILGNSTSKSDQEKPDDKKDTIAGKVDTKPLDLLVLSKDANLAPVTGAQHPPGLTAGGFKG